MINKHWCQAFFSQELISVTSLTGGKQHQVELIELADNSKWICKTLSSQTWLGKTKDLNLVFTEAVAAKVATELGITFAAYTIDKNPILTLNKGQQAIIRPYCEGLVLSRLNAPQALLLGRTLAQIHSRSLPINDGQPFPPIVLTKTKRIPPWLDRTISQCNRYRLYESDKWVVGHRDLHAGNLVWSDAKTVHLLDWESCGLIHPFIELIGLAMNCAGVAASFFDEECFRATLMGYGPLPKTDALLWKQSFHSWLLWYSYSLQQGWLDDAAQTLESLELIKNKQADMARLYDELSPS